MTGHCKQTAHCPGRATRPSAASPLSPDPASEEDQSQEAGDRQEVLSRGIQLEIPGEEARSLCLRAVVAGHRAGLWERREEIVAVVVRAVGLLLPNHPAVLEHVPIDK